MKIDKSWYIKPRDKNYPTQMLAGGVVVRREKGILLIAFIKDKKFTKYILPKGRIEIGESEVEAAKREISEEIGLEKIRLVCKLGIKQRLTFNRKFWNVYHYFLFVTKQKSGIQKLEKGEKDYVLVWFDINNLPPMFWPEQEELIIENKDKIQVLLT